MAGDGGKRPSERPDAEKVPEGEKEAETGCGCGRLF